MILVGMGMGAMLISPASAHFLDKISHLRQHLDTYFLTQSEGNNNYLGEQAKAADSDLFDGQDSSAFVTATTGKAADADKLDALDSTAFLRTTGKATDADKLDNIDSAAFVQGATTLTRYWSCPGGGFHPTADGATWGVSGALRIGNGTFRCSASIPHNATVTSVSFHLRDSAGNSAGPCEFSRSSATGTVTNLADVAVTSGTPNDTTLTDGSITSPVVDKSLFTYWAECDISGNAADAGVYGVNVTYTITAANG